MSGLTGIIGALGSSILSNIGSKKRQKLADQQNVKFWQMQNAYNTPAQQMARLKKAGLNPALIYGSGSTNTGVAGAVSPSKASPYNVKDPVPSMVQTQLLDAQRRNLEKDIEVKDADLQDRKAKRPGYEAESTIKQIQAKGFSQNEAKIIEGILGKAKKEIADGNQAGFQASLREGEKKAQDAGFYKGQYQATFIEGVLGLPLKDLDKKIPVPPIPGIYDGGVTTMRNVGFLLYGAFKVGKLLLGNITAITDLLKKALK